MKIDSIRPFARYVRILNLTGSSIYDPSYPLDNRLFYLLKGEGRIFAAQQEYKLSPGDVILLNAGTPYHLLPCQAAYLAVNFDLTQSASSLASPIPPLPLKDADPHQLTDQSVIEGISALHGLTLLRSCQSVEMDLLQLKAEYEQRLMFSNLQTSALLLSIIVKILRISLSRDTSKKQQNIADVAAYIRANCHENLNNRALAAKFHYHPNYLSSEFKRHFGVPLHAYLLQARLTKAAAMIESRSGSIGEISLACGFSDANYFTRAFKAHFNYTPKAFLKN